MQKKIKKATQENGIGTKVQQGKNTGINEFAKLVFFLFISIIKFKNPDFSLNL